MATTSSSLSADRSSTRQPLSAWELGKLLVPLHEHRQRAKRPAKVRPHFIPILAFVYRSRYCIADQIRRRFGDVLRSDRTTRRHLAELEDLGWLGIVPTRATGPLWPKTYFLTRHGARRLRKALQTRGKPGDVIRVERTRPEGSSAETLLHELWITEYLLMTWEATQASNEFSLLKVERRSIASTPAFRVAVAGKLTRLNPDAVLLFRQQGSEAVCTFLEVDTGTESCNQLREKLRRYDVWLGSSQQADYLQQFGQDRSLPTRVLMVLGSKQGRTSSRRREQVLQLAGTFSRVAQRLQIITVEHLPAGSLLG